MHAISAMSEKKVHIHKSCKTGILERVCVQVWGLGLDSCSAITAHPAWAPSVQHLRVAVIPDREGY